MSSSSASTGRGSMSMVSTDKATGWHVFKVQGYSQCRATANVGTPVSSGAFSVGGHSWRILYLPCGTTGKQNAGWVCFGLQLVVSPAANAYGRPVKATFTLSLLGEDGAPLPSPYTRASGQRYFPMATGRNPESHFRHFIRIETLDSLYHTDDCFRIRCDLTVFLETLDQSKEPPPELHRHLGTILATGVGGDVTFVVGKETFIAHKNVLAARSPVFMAEFFGGMMEEKQPMARVRIFGIDARAFKAMLHFIYTDSLPEMDQGDKLVMAQHLLVAADRYDIQRLKLICENKLCMFVNASVALTTLVLAEKHGCGRLKEACMKLLKVRGNFLALGYDDYSYLKRWCPSLLDELLAEHGL